MLIKNYNNLTEKSPYFSFINSNSGARGSAVGLRHCDTSRKVAGSIPDGVIRIFR